MTDANWRVLDAIVGHWRMYGTAPTIRELADTLDVNPNAVVYHLRVLEKLKAIEWHGDLYGKARCIWPAGLQDKIRTLAGEYDERLRGSDPAQKGRQGAAEG